MTQIQEKGGKFIVYDTLGKHTFETLEDMNLYLGVEEEDDSTDIPVGHTWFEPSTLS
jgi:hypothetical protein